MALETALRTLHPFVKTGLKYGAPYWTKAGQDFKFGSRFKLVDQKLLNGKKILQVYRT